ncbi:hypothetical protein OS493_035497 [Desmophyllum pertusum]|uniref:UPAR/Ly6 domain-containing protein n=1 Tax=Desmophyllum pertusum TaxID=174260 RepID=A0A9W9YYA1_9CNID|nr:hypothetical protein OS493_035497 [Desmophyllum pertusum]
MTDTICTFAAHGLKCFTCISYESLDDCEKDQMVQECPSYYTRCINMTLILPPSTGFETKQFARGCSPVNVCNYAKQGFESCKSFTSLDLQGQNVTCDVSCCTNDLCNESAVPVVSIVMLVACALWALVR